MRLPNSKTMFLNTVNDVRCMHVTSASLPPSTTMSESPPPPFLLFVMIDELCWELVKYLRVPDLFRLRCLTRFMKLLVDAVLPRRFSINRSLRDYFNHPDAFRLLQARTGAVISGSFARNFFTVDFRTRPALDLYVSYEAASAVGTWLEVNGYQFSPFGARLHSMAHQSMQAPNYGWHAGDFLNAVRRMRAHLHTPNFYINGVLGVFEFIKVVDGHPRRVQLVAVRCSPAETILSFDSSTRIFFSHMTCY